MHTKIARFFDVDSLFRIKNSRMVRFYIFHDYYMVKN